VRFYSSSELMIDRAYLQIMFGYSEGLLYCPQLVILLYYFFFV
jgi:hypothetical protein